MKKETKNKLWISISHYLGTFTACFFLWIIYFLLIYLYLLEYWGANLYLDLFVVAVNHTAPLSFFCLFALTSFVVAFFVYFLMKLGFWLVSFINKGRDKKLSLSYLNHFVISFLFTITGYLSIVYISRYPAHEYAYTYTNMALRLFFDILMIAFIFFLVFFIDLFILNLTKKNNSMG